MRKKLKEARYLHVDKHNAQGCTRYEYGVILKLKGVLFSVHINNLTSKKD